MSNDIQHKPAVRVGIEASDSAAWESGELVPVQPAQAFEYPEDPAEPDPDEQEQERLAFDHRQAACYVLALLCDGDASAKVIGKRALALAYALKASPYENQIALAKRMGCTAARAGQILSALKREALAK